MTRFPLPSHLFIIFLPLFFLFSGFALSQQDQLPLIPEEPPSHCEGTPEWCYIQESWAKEETTPIDLENELPFDFEEEDDESADAFARTRVILKIMVVGSEQKTEVAIPLEKFVPVGSDTGNKLASAEIVDIVHSSKIIRHPPYLDSVICDIIPLISAEERDYVRQTGGAKPELPYLKYEDGKVDFRDPASRWFMAWREILGLECR